MMWGLLGVCGRNDGRDTRAVGAAQAWSCLVSSRPAPEEQPELTGTPVSEDSLDIRAKEISVVYKPPRPRCLSLAHGRCARAEQVALTQGLVSPESE